MKRITYTWLTALTLAAVFITVAGAQSDLLGIMPGRSAKTRKRQPASNTITTICPRMTTSAW